MGSFSPAVIQNLDIKKYLGRWYEIARIDYRFEKGLDQVTAEYSLRKDGLIKVDNKGYDIEKKKWKQSVGKAKFKNASNEGSLRVSFFLFFYAAYNILLLDENYKYALVGGDSKDYLWILSREKTIPDKVRESYLNHADSLGYHTRKLYWVSQS